MVIINDLQVGDAVLSAQDIVATLLKHEKWLFSRGTAKVRYLKAGDRVVVYAAGKGNRCFVGNFTLKTMPIEEDNDHSTELKSLLRYFPLSCQIKEASLWAKSLPIKDILDDLSFIGDKKNYGLYLRQGMRELSEGDYAVIVGNEKSRSR